MKIKTNDTVIVLTGTDKGKKGKVISAQPKDNSLFVKDINLATRHQKPRQQGEQGGRVKKKEAKIDISNVMLICPKCKKPTRVGHIIENGKKYRACKKCEKRID